ncbi:MAG: DoxX family protein [Propionibacteriaceae bacterium]|jgi:putative oxidoreductase|nr:DoxX family protein [Propionibacteriaceae bacterium]
MQKFLRGLESAVLFLTRIGFGAVMFVHGWTRIVDGSGQYVPRLEAAGLPAPTLFFWGAVVLEIGGGVLLAFGVLTRIVAAVFGAEFVMTGLWLHWWNGFAIRDGGYEYSLVLVLLALVLVGFGGGVVAVDHLIFGRKGDDDQAAYPSY